MPHLQNSALAAAASLADGDDEVPIPRFPSCSALVWCDSDDEVLILRPMLSCLPSTSFVPLSLCSPLSCPQAGGRGLCLLGYG
jgi:hypothetical protein